MNKRRFARLSGLILIVFGSVFLLKPMIQNYLVKQVIESNAPMSITRDTIVLNQKETAGEFDFDQTFVASWEGTMASYQNRQTLPVIGGLAIPSLDLALPILYGVADENLYAGAGTMTPDQRMGSGNYSLVSHNMAKPGLLFSDLQSLPIGEQVYLTDLETVYVYTIQSLEKVAPSRVDVIAPIPEKRLVTLVTCSDDLQYRWIAQGELQETLAIEDVNSDILALFQLELDES